MLKWSETPLVLLALLPKILATMAFRKPHLKEKLQAWNLAEARLLLCFCGWYLPILTETRFIFIQNSPCFILSCKFIGIRYISSPNITNPVSAWNWTQMTQTTKACAWHLGLRNVLELHEAQWHGPKEKLEERASERQRKRLSQCRPQTGWSLGIKMGCTNEREVKKHKHPDKGSKIRLSRHQNMQRWERHV